MSTVGFLVWNPGGGLPTRVHDTLDRALREAERLTAANPGQRFVIMAPVLSKEDAVSAKAWSDGKAEGLAQAHREIMRAEAISDRTQDELAALRRRVGRFEAFYSKAESFQTLVADCQCWLDGLLTAFRLRDDGTLPWTPDVGRLRDLNQALRDLRAGEKFADLDDEIPF